MEEKGEIHCLGREARELVGRARMAVTRSDTRTGCLLSSSENAHLKCDSGLQEENAIWMCTTETSV